RRLARAGRPRYQENAVGAFDDLLEHGEVRLAEAQLLDGHLNVGLVQDPHDDRLAVGRGQNADAQVVVPSLDVHFDSAVLRPAFLGDVESRHDLQTGQDRGQQPPRGTVALHQQTVDPVPDANPALERLDVNVAGAQAHGFLDNQVDQLDDR